MNIAISYYSEKGGQVPSSDNENSLISSYHRRDSSSFFSDYGGIH
jgi:hypothetical protein